MFIRLRGQINEEVSSPKTYNNLHNEMPIIPSTEANMAMALVAANISAKMPTKPPAPLALTTSHIMADGEGAQRVREAGPNTH